MAKNKVINTVLRLKDDMSGGLLQAAKNAKKAGAGITDEMMKSTRQVIAWKNKAVSAATDVAKKVAAVGASAAGAAVTGLSAMAVKAGLAADDLNTLSKQSGFSTSDIQKWQYASDRIDVSVDDIVGAAKKMKKNMTSSSKDTIAVWKQLGIAVKNENGELRDSSAVFYDTLGALSKVRNETERDTLAMTLFGKSADSLAGIVDDGGAALMAFGKEAEDAGLILSQDALDSANAFNDVLDTLKAKAAGAFGKAGNKLATALLPAAERLGPMLEDALNGPLMDKFTAAVDAASAKIQAWVDGGGVERLASGLKNNLSPALDAGREALDFFREHSDEVKTAVKILARGIRCKQGANLCIEFDFRRQYRARLWQNRTVRLSVRTASACEWDSRRRDEIDRVCWQGGCVRGCESNRPWHCCCNCHRRIAIQKLGHSQEKSH